MQLFVQFLINGLTIGMAYALVAVGFSLVFGILRLINFSHGTVYAFGAHMTLVFIGMAFNIWVAIFASIIISGLLGYAVNKVALMPLRKKKSMPIAALITTVGVSYIIQNMLMVVLGSERKAFPNFMGFGSITIAGHRVMSSQVVLFLVSLVLLIGLMLIINKTKMGLAMRALEQNTKAANLMGIKVESVISFTFFLGGVSAAIAGNLVGAYFQLAFPTMGFMMGIKAFAAAVLGGVGALYGAVIGGLIVGVAETMAAGYLGGGFRDAFAFIILIVILIIRPAGLFGKQKITKV